MEALWLGVVTGMGLAISTGPVFLTLVQLSVARGFRKALLFIAGVALADWFMVFTLWFGLNKLNVGLDESVLRLVGGMAIMVFGTTFLFSGKKNNQTPTSREQGVSNKKKRLERSALFMKGIVMAGFNPIVWAFWAGVSQFSITKFAGHGQQVAYFIGILITVFAADLAKAFYAQKLKPFFTSKLLGYFNMGIGILLMVLGGQFVVKYLLS